MKIVRGNILDDPSEILVVPVNCVPGVMGAGLAKVFAERFVGLKQEHEFACRSGLLWPGSACLVPKRFEGKRALFFATKDHWRDASRYEWIWGGLTDMANLLRGQEPVSLALPALGCGLGGLAWPVIYSMVGAWSHTLPAGTALTVYEPEGR